MSSEVLTFLGIAGNTELIKLLVKRKANTASTNKSKKTAMDLAKTAEVKAVLQEAIDAAAQQAEATQAEVPTGSTAEDASMENASATAPQQAAAPSLGAEPAEMIGPQIGPSERPPSQHVATAHQQPQIGPPERPPSNGGLSQTAVSPAEPLLLQQPRSLVQNDDSSTVTADKQPENDRPVKKQKVALSFDEDEDEC